MQKQVEATHYDFKVYISKGRWNSFYHQIDEIISKKPDSILEIGIGSGLLGIVLKKMLHCNYASMDIDNELKPDYIGSILNMPFHDKQYDVIGCFEVLEHLPYENFEKCLSELFRVANNAVIISLPDAGRVIQLQIPKICHLKMIKKPFAKITEHKFDGEHYWEINKKNYEINKIIKKMKEVAKDFKFKLEKNYRVWENPYHHFFIFERSE
jgi:ubiquinone/menaquinone biosynthesis C-methylase UbiE